MNDEIHDLTRQVKKLEERVRKPRKDKWDRLQVLGSISLPVVIAFGGVYFNTQLAARQATADLALAARQEAERQAQAATQRNDELAQLVLNITSQRELADTQIRAQMFSSLMEHFFSDTDELGDKVTLLYLIQTNFVEYFNARALFEALHQEIEEEGNPAVASELKKQMREAATAIVDRQEILLSNQNIHRLRVYLGGDAEPVEVGDHSLSISLEGGNEDFASIVLHAELEDLGFSEIRFKVAYYDMPLTDYTTLPDDHRFAVTFKGGDTDDEGVLRFADLNVIEFEDTRILSRDRPTISSIVEMLQSLQENGLPESHGDDHGGGR